MSPQWRLLGVALLLGCHYALAEPADYVYTPKVEYGEREIELKAGSLRKAGQPRESAASLALGWGVKERWFTELYVKYKRESNEGTKPDAFEWENRFQLTDIGEYPVDVGFVLEIERPRDHAEGWETNWGPLFQTEFGRLQVNANALFRRSFRGEAPPYTQFHYQLQAKYRWRPEFEFGVQGFGDPGEKGQAAPANQRSLRAGPAVFGKLYLSGRRALKYNAAWLLGASADSPGHSVRLQVEYEF